MTAPAAELEAELKQVLYRYLEEIRATKAALYLLSGPKRYELATQYGFRGGPRKSVENREVIVDRLLVRRGPYVVNGLAEDPAFSELLYEAGTNHLLVVPIYSRGRLVGFVDLRDKPNGAPFQSDDFGTAQQIADEFADLFARNGLYSPMAIEVSPSEERDREPEPRLESGVSEVVERARAAISRGVLGNAGPAERIEPEVLDAGAALLPGILVLPGVVMAALTTLDPEGGEERIVSRGEITPAAQEHLRERIDQWIARREEVSGRVESSTELFDVAIRKPVTPERLASLLTAPVRLDGSVRMALSVGFEGSAVASSRKRLERFLLEIERNIARARGTMERDSMAEIVARRLVEPDFGEFPLLMAHSRRVADLAERVARGLGFPQQEVKRIRLAGLVHDVGMRLLDYRRLYRKEPLTPDDMKRVREHPMVGAALVAQSALGSEVARIVYAHHERFDGGGYPRGLAGGQISREARLVHLCEAWDAMTASDSYQKPIESPAALENLQAGGGTQFDPELVEGFCSMMA